MTLSADLLRGYTDAIILRQLSKGDSYGYMISKTERGNAVYRIQENGIRRPDPVLLGK